MNLLIRTSIKLTYSKYIDRLLLQLVLGLSQAGGRDVRYISCIQYIFLKVYAFSYFYNTAKIVIFIHVLISYKTICCFKSKERRGSQDNVPKS